MVSVGRPTNPVENVEMGYSASTTMAFTIQLGYSAWASDGHRNSKFLRKSLEVRSQGPMNGHRPSANPTFGALYIHI